MSSESKRPIDDRELDDFLAGQHPVGRAYREASQHDTAPRELDDAILAASRESVQPRPRPRPRWLQPFALAATLVLGVSVLINLWRDPALREQALTTAPASDINGQANAVADATRESEGAAQAEAQQPRAANDEAREAVAAQSARKAKQEAAPASLAPPAPPALPAPTQAPALATPSTPAVPGADAAPVLQDRAEPQQPREPAEPPWAAPALAPAAEPEPLHKRAPRAAAFERTAPMQNEDAGARAGAAARAESAAVEALSEAQWISRLRDAWAREDETAARAALAGLRQAYPDADLPEDLRAFAARIDAKAEAEAEVSPR